MPAHVKKPVTNVTKSFVRLNLFHIGITLCTYNYINNCHVMLEADRSFQKDFNSHVSFAQ